ncbi:MAG: (Fe-S)-binding protein [Methylobacter sp.]
MFEFDLMSFDSEQQPQTYGGFYIPDADECRRCGICVTGCPTFRLFGIDEETPRRRLRSLAKLLEDQALEPEELDHLDNCLQCRACELVCPSRMAYGELFDAGLAKLHVKPSWQAKLGLALVMRKQLRQWLLPLLTLYLRSGMQKPLRASGLLDKLNLTTAEGLACEPALTGLSGIYPVKTAKLRGRVALFTGCLAEHFDRDTQLAAINLLNAIGYEVVVPAEQNCCGAMHRHNGLPAQNLIEQNLAAFHALEVEAVLYSASGCGAMLASYRGDDPDISDWFQRSLLDINGFLLDRWPEDLQLSARSLNVAVHEPCSQRNVLKNGKTVYALLKKIPDLNIEPLPDNGMCCGAGGSYMLTHPDNADQLRQMKRQTIAGCGADCVVSGNFGCSFYLNAERSAEQPKLISPLQLLAEVLPD